jgi:hypothetical protein
MPQQLSNYYFRGAEIMGMSQRYAFAMPPAIFLLMLFLLITAGSRRSSAQIKNDDCWEYRILQFAVDNPASEDRNTLVFVRPYRKESKEKIVAKDTLNALGREGWELFSAAHPSGYYGLGDMEIFYLKRRCKVDSPKTSNQQRIDSLEIQKRK